MNVTARIEAVRGLPGRAPPGAVRHRARRGGDRGGGGAAVQRLHPAGAPADRGDRPVGGGSAVPPPVRGDGDRGDGSDGRRGDRGRVLPGGAPAVVALWSLAETRDRRVSLAVLAPMVVFLEADNVCSPPVSIGAWMLGVYMQTRRRYVRAVEERAATLEREREQLDLIAAQRERTSIARELHDIVAHSVTVMLIGVRGARDVLPTDPEVAARTLARVETTAEQSLTELRRILILLRGLDAPETRPQPSLADLDDLVAGYGAAGLPVQVEISGDRRDLPSGVELSAYRIVEEALTNALKHAQATMVTVSLRFGGTDLEVRVLDDGTGNGEAGPEGHGEAGPGRHGEAGSGGHGLVGMRERVAVLGGELETGRGPGGGFRVAARLPLGEGA
ncbi:sensor histidine kinase [Actinomadura madurae]|uniref:sensor histidine kinase n=1 Tax=Actinomadura madurae TaxID=1993 RepID=UPI0020D24208|nr:sensor histidine kinase [Actinomadura madurae]MCQ0005968.1 sensor histidine kinase [Actinomadura madurae]